MIRQLTSMGFSADVAERRVDAELAALSAVRVPIFGTPATVSGRELLEAPASPFTTSTPAPAIVWPFRLLIPWSHLVSDNKKTRAVLIRDPRTKEGWRAIERITEPYATAKEKIAQLAASKLAGAAAVHRTPLELWARVWVPDEREHDVPNFAKLVRDALEGVVYERDAWIHADHFVRAGVDVDAPRAELTIAPIATSGG